MIVHRTTRADVDRLESIVLTLMVLVVTGFVYLAVIDLGWAYDDHLTLPMAVTADSWRDWPNGTHALTDWTMRRQAGSPAAAYHLANVVIHLANIGLLVAVARLLGASVAAAALASFVFALHPIQVDAVAHVSQRGELLVAFGALAAAVGVASHTGIGLVAAVGGVILAANARPSGVLAVLPLVLVALQAAYSVSHYSWSDPRRRWVAGVEVLVFAALGAGAVVVVLQVAKHPWLVDLGDWTWRGWAGVQAATVVGWAMQVVSAGLVPPLTLDQNLAGSMDAWRVEGLVGLAVVWLVAVWQLGGERTRWLVLWLAATVGWRIVVPAQEFWTASDGYLAMAGVAGAVGVWVDQWWDKEVRRAGSNG